MAYASTVDPTAARQALAAVVPRLTELIRSIRNPGAPALGEWNAGQVAVHLAHAWEILPSLSQRRLDLALDRPEDLAFFTTSMVEADECADVQVAAARIDAAASAYLATPLDDSGERPWLFAGTALPASAFTCH